MIGFPSKNQNADTQKKDEEDCYTWAPNSSGVALIKPTKAAGDSVDTSADVGAVVEAAKSAAAGDNNKGVVLGGIPRRRAKKYGDAKKQEVNNKTTTKV